MDEVLRVGDEVLYPFVLEPVTNRSNYPAKLQLEDYQLQVPMTCACGHMLTVEGLCPDDSSYRKD
jgi:hypothetical protein